jgi:hypothetical protein
MLQNTFKLTDILRPSEQRRTIPPSLHCVRSGLGQLTVNHDEEDVLYRDFLRYVYQSHPCTLSQK